MHAPHPALQVTGRPPRIWRRPLFWAVIFLVALIVGFITRETRRSAAMDAALSAFSRHLSSEEIDAARQDLVAAETLYPSAPRLQLAHRQLKKVEDQLQHYQEGQRFVQDKQWAKAIPLLKDLSTYRDAVTLLAQARLESAQIATASKEWQAALDHLDGIPDSLEGVSDLRHLVRDSFTEQNYQEGLKARAEGAYSRALDSFYAARRIGGKEPAELAAQIQVVSDLKNKAEAAAAIESIRKDENYYTRGAAGIAVSRAEFRQTVGQHFANEGFTFVVLYVGVKNFTLDREHANPNSFTLTAPSGQTSPPHIETYGLNNHVDAVDLREGQETGGWLVFIMPKADTYTLNYDSFRATADKKIAPQ